MQLVLMQMCEYLLTQPHDDNSSKYKDVLFHYTQLKFGTLEVSRQPVLALQFMHLYFSLHFDIPVLFCVCLATQHLFYHGMAMYALNRC